MAKKAAKKRGAKRVSRSRPVGASLAWVQDLSPKQRRIVEQKLKDLRPILEDDDTCERVTPEPIGPGEWRVKKR